MREIVWESERKAARAWLPGMGEEMGDVVSCWKMSVTYILDRTCPRVTELTPSPHRLWSTLLFSASHSCISGELVTLSHSLSACAPSLFISLSLCLVHSLRPLSFLSVISHTVYICWFVPLVLRFLYPFPSTTGLIRTLYQIYYNLPVYVDTQSTLRLSHYSSKYSPNMINYFFRQ